MHVMVRAVLVTVAAVGVAGGLALWLLKPSAMAPTEAGSRPKFDPAVVAQGEALATIGGCAFCHTLPGGARFAGGLPLPTPFGTVHSTNITPDRETGIGTWSEAAFRRAMREGVGRDGRHLYPAFPYDQFAKVSDEDIGAIYAYVMTRAPVRAARPANTLSFPFNLRPLLAVWKGLFLEPGVFRPDPSKSAEWNRGAYLVQGLGHCGSCHSPRNLLGAVRSDQALGGGEAEGWHAPALNGAAPAVVPWTRDSLVNYLIDGWDEHHGIAAGPMLPVVGHLAEVAETEGTAIAAYLESLAPPTSLEAATKAGAAARARMLDPKSPEGASPPPQAADPSFARGQAIFVRACADCHSRAGQPAPLGLPTTVAGPDPRNLVHILLDGIRPPAGAPERSMPGYAKSLTNAELTDLIGFMRMRFTERPAWPDLRARVDAVRPNG